ncbi:hypothetical protein J437_LFUL012642 [Ladona fulva]|uniref:Uncharacterized protein n=1 Tax=Ladona fulva TaxID=123851 RepID=A0A8K0KEP3_LADFU|nr:hypothetical protein J437_LFUL012642 [Ladona fulva]
MEANSWEDLEGQTKGLTVSGDGTWRKRRFNSLQCVSTVIEYVKYVYDGNDNDDKDGDNEQYDDLSDW